MGDCRQVSQYSCSYRTYFTSYRRDDSRWFAGQVYDYIKECFQPEQIFMDIGMEPGLDFVEALEPPDQVVTPKVLGQTHFKAPWR